METIPMLIGALGALTVLAIFLAVTTMVREFSQDEDFANKLREVTTSEFDETEENTSKIYQVKKWWFEKNVRAGGSAQDFEAPARTALIIGVVSLAVGSIVLSNILLGLILLGVGVFSYSSFLEGRGRRRIKKMEKQIPTLLFDMRANIQSNQTASQAILNVVDDIPAPLGDELKIMRDEINVGVPIEVSLRGLAKRVGSAELEFLVASIEIAISSGADLEPQLKIIQEITEERQKATYKLATAVAAVQPTMWIAGLVIPAVFIWSWFQSPDNAAYWTTPQGLLYLVGIAILYGIGFFIARKLVHSVEKS